ncbi:3-deoxy-7-phosphoheptulonate synthase [Luteolibacter yonseiensis]|uniref:Phospho-2-dehydro-3-deoxyheptonate aldolase n=1 Tax=Luteolibacter yonseiensis TaxID=1144680 RepID=A0A934R3X9_9BACT|nr:3-deoxy-7-phosphoheptulonate synthase [Luteolibacter yonseiensis]MBK1815608.1 3-deoxy-7-phosphoheptulonate synthase [Luteolibacter yonseiensis]
MQPVSDIHVSSNLPLPPPADLISRVPREDAQAEFIIRSRREIRDIIFGNDPRLLVIAGPCSIHDTAAGLEYAERFAKLADQVKDRMLLVMRVYFEKPRTTVGWKGLIMDPRLDGSNRIEEGLETARRFLSDVIRLGIPTATELLDPITPQYIADLICWSAIGARTTESQTHRQMASGLSMPLGFKNGTLGNLEPAINAIKAATQPQTFLGVGMDGRASAVTTTGNPDCHIILRGGESGPNHDAGSVGATRELLLKSGLKPAIMIDASHGNCRKDHNLMPAVFEEIVRQRKGGDTSVIGAMLESNLAGGAQKFPQPLDQLVHGQSITDACIDWETTERIILDAARELDPGR